ncbi:protein transport protein SEC24 [Backusella circina FSU 941]|nr:protein transport protein SEC24 [Backusella circina FSU 941]
MNLGESPNYIRQDISLIGNPPPIEDLNDSQSTMLPSSASLTASPFAQCDRSFKRCTLNTLPRNTNELKRTKLPLSLIIEPYPRGEFETVDVPLISHGVITRCMKCKTFINPFVRFLDNGFKWQCNICYLNNDVPPSYDWDHVNQQNVDRWSRPELNFGCVDYVATADFMSRPPQPPVYLFIIDTSAESIRTGMIKVMGEAILSSLNQIPNNDGRTKVGFITVDHAIGFYNLSGKEQPELLIVSDIDDIYIPRAATDLVVYLSEAKNVVSELLSRFESNSMFNSDTMYSKSCLGTALQVGRRLLSATGGKIICFQASLPNIGPGALSAAVIHEQNSTQGVISSISEPTSEFYKRFSEECVRSHVCVDMFVFGSQNIDVATFNVVPKFTGGQTHYFPGFNSHNNGDRDKLKHEIQKLLQEEIGLEAIMRTRCSPGLVAKEFHGNFTYQEPDILVLPNVPRDGSYCIDLSIERELQGDFAYMQTCMLFTTSFGERCIRVMTISLPIAKGYSEIFQSADQVGIVRALTHQAINRAVSNNLQNGKQFLVNSVLSIMDAYTKEILGSNSATQLKICRSLSMLPALILGVLKSEMFNDTRLIPMNIIMQSTILLRTLPMRSWANFAYPTFYAIHNMPLQAGTYDKDKKCIMPPRVNLSSNRIERHGCYLIENGQRILLWIGAEAVPQLCRDLFDVDNISTLGSGQIADLPVLKTQFSERVRRIIQALRSDLRFTNFYPTLYLVKEDGDPLLRNLFMTHLLDDRQQYSIPLSKTQQETINSGMSYFEFLSFIKHKCN